MADTEGAPTGAPTPAQNAATVRQALKSAMCGEWGKRNALDKLDALLAQAEAGALAEGREGMVTAYDHEGRYVGCIGRETWRWLIDHLEVDAPALIRAHEMFSERAFDQQKARAEAAEEWLDNETRRRQAAAADRDAAVRAAEQAQEALRQIADGSWARHAHAGPGAFYDVSAFARAALTGEGTP